MNYNFDDIRQAYKNIGIAKGMTIVLKTDMRFLGPYKTNDQSKLLEDHLKNTQA